MAKSVASSWYAFLLLALLITVAIVVPSWSTISSAGYEGSDFAANSLLVLQAKHLSLIHGNYSRLGFFHPGPAILYVLAAGELIFHDWLHLVKQPLSGQLLAAAIYNAAWLTTVGAVLRRLGCKWASVGFFLIGTMLFLAYQEKESFDGLWFPDLYMLPFLCFTVGLGAVGTGARAGWIAAAVSAGFLINGQASFIGVCGLMGGAALAMNAVMGRRRPAGDRIWLGAPSELSRVWLTLSVALSSLVVLLLPFAFRNLIETPRPLSQYVEVGRNSTRHEIASSLVYLSQYWGINGWYKLLSISSLLVTIIYARRNFAITAVVIGGFLSSIAALSYAATGVDNQSYRYLEVFYATTPSIFVGAALMAVADALLRDKLALGLVVAGAASAALWDIQISQRPQYALFYDHPQVPTLNDDLLRLQNDRPLVVDVADDENGLTKFILWGVEVLHLRRDQPRLCIGQGWNITYTPELRCTPDELATEQHLLFASSRGPQPLYSQPVAKSDDVTIYSVQLPCITPGRSLTVEHDADLFRSGMLLEGWSPIEGPFAWSTAKTAYLKFCAADGVKNVVIRLGAYVPSVQHPQRIELRSNGTVIRSEAFDSMVPRDFSVPVKTGQNLIQFVSPDSASPHDLAGSADLRSLGVSFWSLDALGKTDDPNASQ